MDESAPMNASHVEAPASGGGLPPQVPDMFWINVALGCFVVLLTWAIYAVHNHFLARPKKILKALRLQGIKGYPFRPFVGQLPEIMEVRKKRLADPDYAAATEGFQFFIAAAAQFGNIWTFSVGPHPRVVIGDPALARQVYVQMNDSFPKTDFLQQLTLLRDGLLLVNGAKWTWQRRLINPAFNHKEMRRMFPAIVHSTEEAMGKVELLARLEQDKGQGEQGKGQPLSVNVDMLWSSLTLDVIARSAFGSELGDVVGEGALKALLSTFPEYLSAVIRVIQFSGVFPLFRYLPLRINRQTSASEKMAEDLTRRIVAARYAKHTQQQENGETTDSGDGRTDLLELMMNATEGLDTDTGLQATGSTSSLKSLTSTLSATLSRSPAGPVPGSGSSPSKVTPPIDGLSLAGGGTASDSGKAETEAVQSPPDHVTSSGLRDPKAPKKLSVDQLMANSITFLLAGHETTGNLLTWTSMLLSQHPEWQEKAREEVNGVFEANGGQTPSFEQLSDLKILGWILNESLRLYPPAPMMGRTAPKATQISDTLVVPAGCDVLIPIALIHRDKALWGEDADQFRPDRFANGVSKASIQPGAFMPFALGPRMCIGQNFAIIEAKIAMALFIRRFRFALAPGYKHFSEMSITLRPKGGMLLELTLQ